MKQLKHKIRPGVSLIELLLVMAITIILLPVAFNSLANHDRAIFDGSTQQLQSALRLVLNKAESGIGPEPSAGCPGSAGCPIAPGELLFGQAVVLGGTGQVYNSHSFKVSSENANVTTDYLTYRLKLKAGTAPDADEPIMHYGEKIVDMPQDVGLFCWKSNLVPNCIKDPIGIVFFKLNKSQTTLPVQTRVFTGSSLSNLSTTIPFSCSPGRIDCYGATVGYGNPNHNRIIIMFHGVKNDNFHSCLIINTPGNDVQYKTGDSQCV